MKKLFFIIIISCSTNSMYRLLSKLPNLSSKVDEPERRISDLSAADTVGFLTPRNLLSLLDSPAPQEFNGIEESQEENLSQRSHSTQSWLSLDGETSSCQICYKTISETHLYSLTCGNERDEHLICASCLDDYRDPKEATKEVRPQCGRCAQTINLNSELVKYYQIKMPDKLDELKAALCCKR